MMMPVLFNPYTDSLTEGSRLKLIQGKLYLEPIKARRGKNWLVRLLTRHLYSQRRILEHIGRLFAKQIEESPPLTQTYRTLLEKAEMNNRSWAPSSLFSRFFKGKLLIPTKVHQRALERFHPLKKELPPPISPQNNPFENLKKDIMNFVGSGDVEEDQAIISTFIDRANDLKGKEKSEIISLLNPIKELRGGALREKITPNTTDFTGSKLDFKPANKVENPDPMDLFFKEDDPEASLSNSEIFLGNLDSMQTFLEYLFLDPHKQRENNSNWKEKARNVGLELWEQQEGNPPLAMFIPHVLERIGIGTAKKCFEMNVTTFTAFREYLYINQDSIIVEMLKNFALEFEYEFVVGNVGAKEEEEINQQIGKHAKQKATIYLFKKDL